MICSGQILIGLFDMPQLIWKQLFKRTGYPYFILHLAQEAYAQDMEAALGWGYSDQLFIYDTGTVTSFYSTRDAHSFREFITTKIETELFELLNIIERRAENLQEIATQTAHELNSKILTSNELVLVVTKMYQAYRDLYAVYRLPTLIDLELETDLSNGLMTACAKAKDIAGEAFNAADLMVLPLLRKQASQLLAINEDKILHLKFEELVQSLAKKNLLTKPDLSERNQKWILVTIDRKIFHVPGDEMNEWLAKHSFHSITNENDVEIKGRPCYKGITTGKVFIPKNLEDLQNIPEQSILVMPMTTIDVIKYLNNVIGIITDEGGVTCHAAIISREMKIPCIVGAKNATAILKNGDQVLLDAISGVVKKLVL